MPLPTQAPAAPASVPSVSALFGGVFKGLKGTKPTVDAVYFQQGKYWCRIDKTGVVQTRKNGNGLKIETTVIKVLEEVPGKSHRVGECPTRLFLQKDDYFLGDIVATVGAIFEVDPTQVGEEEALAAFDERQALRNVVVEVHAREVPTQKGGIFTKIKFLRQVPPAELLGVLSDDEKTRFFAPNYLEGMAAALAEG